jgi:thioredoxin reductase (NADPH)
VREALDCLVVGAGPAGLVAATYLARYRRRIAVVDAGASRARWIPTSHNCPGFPLGVSGTTLLARLREQAEQHGVVVTRGRIEALEQHMPGNDGGARERAGGAPRMFVARDAAGGEWRAAAVILATGIVDRLPEVEGGPDALADAIEAGTLRLCAICDAYEAQDSHIAVLAPGEEARTHAAFLRTFSRNVDAIDSDVPYRLDCDAAGCRIETDADGNASRTYDTLYPVLGGDAQSQLARTLGAAVDDEGALRTDAHQQTSVDGLYAIGDVVSALNQIAVAVGHAAIAATAVHNRLPPNPRAG